MTNSISVHYFKKNSKSGNFGDELNTFIPNKLFNTNVEWTDKGNCDYLLIGSILTILLKKYENQKTTPVKVWGSGFIKDITSRDKLYRDVEVYAVRGKKTLEDLQKLTGKIYKDIVFGDPGLLISECYKDLKLEKKYKYGIIPHYIDQNDENLKKIQLPNSLMINILDPIDKVVRDICSCECILSSAMHGLIAADSFGIPNIRFIASYKLMGGEYKFNDYYSAFDMKQPDFIDLRNIDVLKNINFEYKINYNKVREIQTNLMKVFPHA